MNNIILIVGGSGNYGRPVAKQLQKDGYVVRIFSRDVNRARAKLGNSFEYFQGDVRFPETLIEASEGCSGLHINLNSNTLKQIHEVEYEGTQNCISAARSNKLGRITLTSRAYVKRGNTGSPLIRTKWRIEEMVRTSGIPYTIFAPARFMESLPGYIKGDRAIIIGNQNRKVSWLSVMDYARLVSRAFASQKAVNKKFFIAGPGSCTLEEALIIYCNKKFPGATIYRTSLGGFMFMSSLTLNRKLVYVATLMKIYSRVDDSTDMAETIHILGKPSIRLEDWMASL
jgi:uncharacterized protein YbjT (DUF2867 family)